MTSRQWAVPGRRAKPFAQCPALLRRDHAVHADLEHPSCSLPHRSKRFTSEAPGSCRSYVEKPLFVSRRTGHEEVQKSKPLHTHYHLCRTCTALTRICRGPPWLPDPDRLCRRWQKYGVS